MGAWGLVKGTGVEDGWSEGDQSRSDRETTLLRYVLSEANGASEEEVRELNNLLLRTHIYMTTVDVLCTPFDHAPRCDLCALRTDGRCQFGNLMFTRRGAGVICTDMSCETSCVV